MAKPSYHELQDAELVDQLADTKDELFKLRFQHATGQLTSPARLRQVRRNVARIETELRAREIAAAEAMASASGSSEEDR